jgi:hypothetical protein
MFAAILTFAALGGLAFAASRRRSPDVEHDPAELPPLDPQVDTGPTPPPVPVATARTGARSEAHARRQRETAETIRRDQRARPQATRARRR